MSLSSLYTDVLRKLPILPLSEKVFFWKLATIPLLTSLDWDLKLYLNTSFTYLSWLQGCVMFVHFCKFLESMNSCCLSRVITSLTATSSSNYCNPVSIQLNEAFRNHKSQLKEIRSSCKTCNIANAGVFLFTFWFLSFKICSNHIHLLLGMWC